MRWKPKAWPARSGDGKINIASMMDMQAWYGVSEFQSLATGKPFFIAHSGVESVGTTIDALYRFAPNLALVGRGAVNYLVANVARSPVIERRVQTTLGLGISYLFQ